MITTKHVKVDGHGNEQGGRVLTGCCPGQRYPLNPLLNQEVFEKKRQFHLERQEHGAGSDGEGEDVGDEAHNHI